MWRTIEEWMDGFVLPPWRARDSFGKSGPLSAWLTTHSDQHTTTDTLGSRLIHQAARHGHDEMVRACLVGGASPNSRDSDGYSPLHVAASKGYGKVVDTLLAAGACVEMTNNFGRTALEEARDAGHEHLVARLKVEMAGVSPLDRPAMRGPVMRDPAGPPLVRWPSVASPGIRR
jgi:Ankyrin repeats (3 copies)